MNFKRIRPSLLRKMKKVNNTRRDRRWETENALDVDPINCDSKSSTSIYEAPSFFQDFSWNQNDSPKPPFSKLPESGQSSKPSAQLRVRFFDEANGLTPHHIVTGVRYRPKTLQKDISELFYTSREYEVFKKENFIWKLEVEIVELQKIQGRESGENVASLVDTTEVEKRTMELIESISRQYNTSIDV